MQVRKFDPNHAQRLDTTDRLEWNSPAEIVAACRISSGARVAEIGCGTGWFTFELERVTRPRGMVFALDMQPAMLQILRAKRDSWERILTLPCSENEFELDDDEVDLVFHANTLHECAAPEIHLKEVNRVLKPGGRLVVVEWLWCDEESQPGPPNLERLESRTVQSLVEDAGFAVQEIYDVGPYHYALQATKKS